MTTMEMQYMKDFELQTMTSFRPPDCPPSGGLDQQIPFGFIFITVMFCFNILLQHSPPQEHVRQKRRYDPKNKNHAEQTALYVSKQKQVHTFGFTYTTVTKTRTYPGERKTTLTLPVKTHNANVVCNHQITIIYVFLCNLPSIDHVLVMIKQIVPDLLRYTDLS